MRINTNLNDTNSMTKNNTASQETISQDSKIDCNDETLDKKVKDDQIISENLKDDEIKQSNSNRENILNEELCIIKEDSMKIINDLIEINESIEIAQINETIDISDNNIEEKTKCSIIVLDSKTNIKDNNIQTKKLPYEIIAKINSNDCVVTKNIEDIDAEETIEKELPAMYKFCLNINKDEPDNDDKIIYLDGSHLKEQEDQKIINKETKDTLNKVTNQDNVCKLIPENTNSKDSEENQQKLKDDLNQTEKKIKVDGNIESQDIDLNEDDDELPDIG